MTAPLRRSPWWIAVPIALALGALIALGADRASTPAHAQAGSARIAVTPAQLRINQRISQAAVRRSNEALRRLNALGAGAGQAAGPQGPQGPPGPAATSISTYDTYIHRIGFGEEVTLASNGPLRYFGRCVLNESGNDFARVFVVSTTAGAFSTAGGALTANVETLVFSNSVTTGNTSWNQDIDDNAAYAQAGGQQYYLAIDGETLGLGVNVLGPGCTFAGSSFQATRAL